MINKISLIKIGLKKLTRKKIWWDLTKKWEFKVKEKISISLYSNNFKCSINLGVK